MDYGYVWEEWFNNIIFLHIAVKRKQLCLYIAMYDKYVVFIFLKYIEYPTVSPLWFQEIRLYSKYMTGKWVEQSATGSKSDSESDSDDETFSKTRVRHSVDEFARINYVFIIFIHSVSIHNIQAIPIMRNPYNFGKLKRTTKSPNKICL